MENTVTDAEGEQLKMKEKTERHREKEKLTMKMKNEVGEKCRKKKSKTGCEKEGRWWIHRPGNAGLE